MNLDAYFARIGHHGPRDTSMRALAAIAHRHAMAIPFENIGVLARGAPDLDERAVEDKLVARRRGGYCFEQNHLLLAVLRRLGFAVDTFSARVRFSVPTGMPMARTHMVLRVTTDEGPHLVDAGFGGFTLTAPVRLATPEPQATSHETVRVVADAGVTVLQVFTPPDWRDVYAFDFVPQLPIDYVQQNWYTATKPGGLFTGNLVVAMPVERGRRTLFNRTFKERTIAGGEERTSIDSIGSLRAILDSKFGLRIDEPELLAAWDASGRGLTSHPMLS